MRSKCVNLGESHILALKSSYHELDVRTFDTIHMMEMLNKLVKGIKTLPRKQKTLLVAIDGRGGSGKSSLAEQLKQNLENVTTVHLDYFAYPETDRDRLLNQVILPLQADNKANYQRFDWGTRQIAEWHCNN